MVDLEWEYKIALATIPVLWIASLNFGQPSWSRSYTTAALYRGAWLAFLAMHLIVLVVACALLKRVWDQPGTVWVGLGITLLLTGWPPLVRPARAWLHAQAGIPSNAHALAKELAENGIVIDEATRNDAKQLLITRGLDVDDEWAGLDVPAHRLLEATGLFLKLCRWEQDRRFKSFLREADNDYYALRTHFDQLSLKIPRTLDSIRRIGEILHLFHSERAADAPPSDPKLQAISRRVVNDLINDACKDIADLHDEACLFAARGVLVRCPTGARRQKMLRGIGFDYEDDSRPTRVGVLAKAGLLLYVGIWTVTLILPSPIPSEGDDISIPARVAMITVIVLTALSITVFTKQRWGFANAGLDGRTPVWFLIGAGICASLFATLVNLATGALLLGGWPGALTRLSYGWPFLHISGFTTIAVAWLVQDHRWRRMPGATTRRFFDAMLLAAVWVVGSILSMLLMNFAAHPIGTFAEHVVAALTFANPASPPSIRYGMPLVSLVFGAIIGATVPESVRRAYPRARAPRRRTEFGAAGSRSGA